MIWSHIVSYQYGDYFLTFNLPPGGVALMKIANSVLLRICLDARLLRLHKHVHWDGNIWMHFTLEKNTIESIWCHRSKSAAILGMYCKYIYCCRYLLHHKTMGTTHKATYITKTYKNKWDNTRTWVFCVFVNSCWAKLSWSWWWWWWNVWNHIVQSK